MEVTVELCARLSFPDSCSSVLMPPPFLYRAPVTSDFFMEILSWNLMISQRAVVVC